ncbi:hypothetical protein BURKHO8Y_210268 [Burkholderia sp. 8Y]|nr:hypothetical protein BURKHO8Y_210268 [Burkholderia sp. 8Y]
MRTETLPSCELSTWLACFAMANHTCAAFVMSCLAVVRAHAGVVGRAHIVTTCTPLWLHRREFIN